ncbi:MAG TPA: carbonic anhydrase [Fimbriimonas sp.]|nr:carbonic anhydrase [Fimbriimonas sp.]
MSHELVFTPSSPWNSERPHVLVVACSDGRLQEPLDEFLRESVGIAHYDRVYLAGGPGALVRGGLETERPNRINDHLLFLIEAHQIESVVLMFHGPAIAGPDISICAEYRRRYPDHTAAQIRKQQEYDTEQILRDPLGGFPSEHVHAYRLEVTNSLGLDVMKIL